MNLQQAIQLARTIVDEKRKGQFIKATWQSEQSPAKAYKGTVTLSRRTTATVRLGIDYSNIGSVREAIDNKERGPVGSLPFNGQWIFFPFVILSSTQKHLFRIYQNENSILHTEFFVNGMNVPESEYVKYLTPSDLKSLTERHLRVCFGVNIENLEVG